MNMLEVFEAADRYHSYLRGTLTYPKGPHTRETDAHLLAMFCLNSYFHTPIFNVKDSASTYDKALRFWNLIHSMGSDGTFRWREDFPDNAPSANPKDVVIRNSSWKQIMGSGVFNT